ncbi:MULTISPECIES: 30S ribosomal protein THX [unclassified Luteimonas]
MGKGDRKTLKGKRYNSSYGNTRPHRVKQAAAVAESASAAGKRVVKPTKKVVSKKTVVKE